MIHNDNKKLITAIGLMSGTSCDGIDVALMKSDGNKIIEMQFAMTIPYTDKFHRKLKEVIGGDYKDILEVEKELTTLHASAVNAFISKFDISRESVNIVGFHGHTIKHLPKEGITWQIGNIPLLNALTKISVVGDFRRKDVACGGQGAPVVPIFLKGISAKLAKPTLFLNVGGVSNICYVDDHELIAFDVGPGNAPMDDLVLNAIGESYDKDGALARKGAINKKLVEGFMSHEFFKQKPPKSLDRNAFDFSLINKLPLSDALATYAEIIAQGVVKSLEFLPKKPAQIYIYGGGANNSYLVERIAKESNLNVVNTDILKINANFLEAYAFAYLAIRCVLKLPITYPSTTGVHQPQSGGVFCLS